MSGQVLATTYLELYAPSLAILTHELLGDTRECVSNMLLPYFAIISHPCWDFMEEVALGWARTLTR